MKEFECQINDTGTKVKDFSLQEAAKQAIDEYFAAWPDRKDTELRVTVKPAKKYKGI